MSAHGPSGGTRQRRGWRVFGTAAALAMCWSLLSPSPSIGQNAPVTEPSELSSYATVADAAPLQLYFDHQARLVPLGPAVSRTSTEVALPSAASAIAWLVDGGVANGLHGTSTGASVPTESSAQQPGGDPEQEYLVAGGPIGAPTFASVRAGRSYARADRSNEPRAYGNAFFDNVSILPAAGGSEDPPGTFDPGATFPGGEPGRTDPQPRGQMAIVSIGHMASTSESIREGRTVTSIAVAELRDINIGNRTSDNRCTNCIRIDSIRVEAFARASGAPGGSEAAYRVTLGRACRRAFNAETGREEDRCLPLDPHDPGGDRGLQSVDEVALLNEQFREPIWTKIPGAGVDYYIGVQIHAGDEHRSPSRSRRTTTPPDDEHRNYAYPDRRARDPDDPDGRQIRPDRDGGEEARAVAEGPDIEVWTITVTQAHDDAVERIAATPLQQLIDQVDQDDEIPGIQIGLPGPGQAAGQHTVPTDQVRAIRRLHTTLGVARASAVARAGAAAGAPGSPAGSTGAAPAAGTTPAFPASVPGAPVQDGSSAGGLGPMRLAIDWASFRIRPWDAPDMALAIALATMAGAAYVMLRRRMGLGS